MGNQQRTGGKRPLNALFAGLAHFIHHKLTDPARRRARSRAGERELARLDDRLLRDIGLTRSQVLAAGYGPLRPGKRSSADAMRASIGRWQRAREAARHRIERRRGDGASARPARSPSVGAPYAPASIARE
jgi:uncharacterized protein YjiS (DUF1127 family)